MPNPLVTGLPPSPIEDFAKAMDRVSFPGLGGSWSLTACTVNAAVGELPTLDLTLMCVDGKLGPDLDELARRNRKLALEDAPADVKAAVETIIELDDALPAGKHLEVVVHDPPRDGSRFEIVVVNEPLHARTESKP